jgi:hypothetical protein
MNLKARQLYEMLARVNSFGERHAGRFPPGTRGRSLFAALGDSVHDAADRAGAQRATRAEAREATKAKVMARKALRKQLEAIRRTARAVGLDAPGFDVKFRIPRGSSDGRLLTASREIAQHATEWVGEFVDHGLPPTFLDRLAAGADRFEHALRDRTAGRDARLAANVSLKTSLDSGVLAARRLDAVVPNVLEGDPAALHAWQVARRIARRRHSKPRDIEPPSNVDAA